MDYDFLDKNFLTTSQLAVRQFREVIEQFRPPDKDLNKLCGNIIPYTHCTTVGEDFRMGAIDGSGEFPILQQDDVFVHLAVAAGRVFNTVATAQHKLSSHHSPNSLFKGYIIIRDDDESIIDGYQKLLNDLLSIDIKDLTKNSDYCYLFSKFGKPLRPNDVRWDRFPFSKASQVATHAYLIRTVTELCMAIRLLSSTQPKYLLLDTSMVYFLLGETLYLPELLRRYLICRANEKGSCVIALNKSHNIPNGDLIGRYAREKFGYKDHWFLRLPSRSLNEDIPKFLHDKEIPPKLCVSYLFKFHATSFPMRIDVDADWWKKHIDHDRDAEMRLFSELDFTCHDVRSYGYPYPLHAAHRAASLTKQERKAIRDILLQTAQSEGVIRGAFSFDAESLHMEGI